MDTKMRFFVLPCRDTCGTTLMVKFDGHYWYRGINDHTWNHCTTLFDEHWLDGHFTAVTEEEAKKIIVKNSRKWNQWSIHHRCKKIILWFKEVKKRLLKHDWIVTSRNTREKGSISNSWWNGLIVCRMRSFTNYSIYTGVLVEGDTSSTIWHKRKKSSYSCSVCISHVVA